MNWRWLLGILFFPPKIPPNVPGQKMEKRRISLPPLLFFPLFFFFFLCFDTRTYQGKITGSSPPQRYERMNWVFPLKSVIGYFSFPHRFFPLFPSQNERREGAGVVPPPTFPFLPFPFYKRIVHSPPLFFRLSFFLERREWGEHFSFPLFQEFLLSGFPILVKTGGKGGDWVGISSLFFFRWRNEGDNLFPPLSLAPLFSCPQGCPGILMSGGDLGLPFFFFFSGFFPPAPGIRPSRGRVKVFFIFPFFSFSLLPRKEWKTWHPGGFFFFFPPPPFSLVLLPTLAC